MILLAKSGLLAMEDAGFWMAVRSGMEFGERGDETTFGVFLQRDTAWSLVLAWTKQWMFMSERAALRPGNALAV
ncbi:hypothetical protein B0T40_23130 [Chromobacterium haemolyticum]|uniref:hypothetical protein n=1 Tax=Chromobacterium haemolyticum TaxID=394935 RepID=UPI0009D9D4D7|nr:hypothetical protein [Chromobacterium haemolyticum]OQS31144.1 hypothetical protein B0T40_23130 [Chromobacterium haemolyticum]